MAKRASNKARPRGRMLLRVRGPDGRTVAERGARNIVLRSGASLVAKLFAGAPGVTAIDTIGIGYAANPASAELIALVPPPADLDIPAEALRTALPPESFAVATDRAGAVQVRITATFRPTRELPKVTEAGLLAGNTLYNQVVFEPVTLTKGQDVTFFWEIDFPFGH